MTASLPLPGTTSSSPTRSVARSLAAVLLAFACLLAAVPTAHAAGASDARAHAADVAIARGPLAHAARSCAPARGLLHTRRSVLRSQRRLLCLMNRTRARFGLRPLRTNRCLHRVAARHAHDMVHRRYFAHTTPNGWTPGRRARASGYVPRRASVARRREHRLGRRRRGAPALGRARLDAQPAAPPQHPQPPLPRRGDRRRARACRCADSARCRCARRSASRSARTAAARAAAERVAPARYERAAA